MEAHYGTHLPLEEVLEEQGREWPEGPLGDLVPARATRNPGLRESLVRAWEALLAREIDPDEFKEIARDLARKARTPVGLLKP